MSLAWIALGITAAAWQRPAWLLRAGRKAISEHRSDLIEISVED